MKKHMERRLARLEAILLKRATTKDLFTRDYRSAAMSIVAFHAGKLAPGESLETALGRALNMPAGESNNAVNPDFAGPELWPLVSEKLDTIVAARLGRPPVLEGPGAKDDCRRRFNVLRELDEEMPAEMKNPRRMLPFVIHLL